MNKLTSNIGCQDEITCICGADGNGPNTTLQLAHHLEFCIGMQFEYIPVMFPINIQIEPSFRSWK